MKRYVVIVFDPKQIVSDNFLDHEQPAIYTKDRLSGRFYLVHGGVAEDQGPYYTDTIADAQQLCGWMATRNPGKTVIWFEAKGQFVSKPAPAVGSTISDKGVLPV
jgi:hypothetical protein